MSHGQQASAAPRLGRGWRGTWLAPHLRRRLLAAVLAAAAILIALSSVTPSPHSPPATTATGSPAGALPGGLRAGQVAAPVRLVDPGVAPLLHPGDVVDVLATPQSPAGGSDASQLPAREVATQVRVLTVAPASNDAALGTLVVLAVSRADAHALAGAEAAGRLSVVLEPR